MKQENEGIKGAAIALVYFEKKSDQHHLAYLETACIGLGVWSCVLVLPASEILLIR